MKTKSVLLFLLISSIGLIAFNTFKKQQKSELGINTRHLKYLEQTRSDVAAIDSMDRYFSRTFKGYAELKRKEYQSALKIGCNTPPTEERYRELLQILEANSLNKQDQALCKIVFRCAIIFQIIDKYPNPLHPTKEEVLSNFLNFVI